jgi:hypothetical protein
VLAQFSKSELEVLVEEDGASTFGDDPLSTDDAFIEELKVSPCILARCQRCGNDGSGCVGPQSTHGT